MKLPKRNKTHIKETESDRIFRNLIPSEWIIREVTERDYGIDYYVEIVYKQSKNKEFVLSGDLVSIQLKSKNTIKWLKISSKKSFFRIKRETASYWFNSLIPVFLFVVETKTKQLYYANVKKQIRRNFDKFIKNKTFAFELNKNLNFKTNEGNLIFFMLYLLEKKSNDYYHYLSDLLLHWKEYNNFITANIGRDFFLEVDEEPELLLHHVYNITQFIYEQLFFKWELKPLKYWYEEDKKLFPNPYGDLHELTMTKILQELHPIYTKMLKTVFDYVTQKESYFWIYRSKEIYEYCMNNKDVVKKLNEKEMEYLD